ncbi:AhpC-TSA-domain-containing protein [Agrocybe pediades]|nr:AhpC-TSA-domain-containing protein [Agrocybe pediades]
MAPRSKPASDAPAPEPRRSGRIASLPTPAVVESKPAKTTKKRSAEAVAADSSEPTQEGGESAAKKDSVPAPAPAESAPAPAPAVPLARIEIGDSLPELILKNEKGEDIQVSELAAEKGVILFLVPKADTPGCTNQACGFRDSYPDFTSLNYTVYCLSADSPTAQSKWQTKATHKNCFRCQKKQKSLPYPLISDPKRQLITALGAGEGGKTKRSHFIFEKGGKLVDKKLPVTPADSPKLAMEFIKSRV